MTARQINLPTNPNKERIMTTLDELQTQLETAAQAAIDTLDRLTDLGILYRKTDMVFTFYGSAKDVSGPQRKGFISAALVKVHNNDGTIRLMVPNAADQIEHAARNHLSQIERIAKIS